MRNKRLAAIANQKEAWMMKQCLVVGLLFAASADWGFLLLSGSTGFAQQPSQDQPINIGLGKQLLLDDYVIAGVHGVHKVSHSIQKRPENPVLRKQYAWEQGVTDPHVLYDASEQKFHMWYRVLDREGKENVGYAWSRDGVKWERPSLGLVEYGGNTANNCVITTPTLRAKPIR